jgi:16S rRNA (guanine966-N2)-methyltransferase
MTLRIAGGLFRSRILKTPRGNKTRPTTEMTRSAVFNICQRMIEGARFLDLFAGSGAMGFEAISRGACFATFVESDRQAAECIRDNAEALGLQQQVQILTMDVKLALNRLMSPFDLIYIDPPYEKETIDILNTIVQKKLLAPHGRLFLEERYQSKVLPIVDNLERIESRRYGLAHIHQFRSIE